MIRLIAAGCILAQAGEMPHNPPHDVEHVAHYHTECDPAPLAVDLGSTAVVNVIRVDAIAYGAPASTFVSCVTGS
jgi:hypothetical protein